MTMMITTNSIIKQAVLVGTLISTTLMDTTTSTSLVVCGFTSSNAFVKRRPLHNSSEQQISSETVVRRTTNMIGSSTPQQTFYDTQRRRVLGRFKGGIIHMSHTSSTSDDGSDTISAVESGDVQVSQRDKDGNILLKEFEEEDALKETEPPTVGIPSANTTEPLPIEQTSREHFFPSSNSNNNSGDNDDDDHAFFDATKFMEDEEKQEKILTKRDNNKVLNSSTSSNTKEQERENDNNKISKDEDSSAIPASPHMSFRKFLTMQDKRVVVTICYSGGSNLRPYFLTAAKRIKHKFPDVLIEKLILPSNDEKSGDDSIFEVLVDGKVVIGRQRASRGGNVSSGSNGGKNVYVSLDRMEGAIVKARRRRRPSTVYETNVLAPAKMGGKKSVSISIPTSSSSSDPKQAALRMDAWRRSKQQTQQQQQKHE